MSQIRRRKRGSGSGVHEQLLDTEEEETTSLLYNSPGKGQLIVHKVFDLKQFLKEAWESALRLLQRCIQLLVPSYGQAKVSILQVQRLEQLREMLYTPFDPNDEVHQETLRELWALAFPGEPCLALKTAKWKDMGWQGDDPATDFRGAGYYGLLNLIYLGEQQPALFERLLKKSVGRRSDWEYPFAVAGLNITFTLHNLLGIHETEELPTTSAGRAFLALLSENDMAFEELYSMAFELLDETWLSLGASYMQFNNVLKVVAKKVEQALNKRPATLSQLEASLYS